MGSNSPLEVESSLIGSRVPSGSVRKVLTDNSSCRSWRCDRCAADCAKVQDSRSGCWSALRRRPADPAQHVREEQRLGIGLDGVAQRGIQARPSKCWYQAIG